MTRACKQRRGQGLDWFKYIVAENKWGNKLEPANETGHDGPEDEWCRGVSSFVYSEFADCM
jgi:hypothetical protein